MSESPALVVFEGTPGNSRTEQEFFAIRRGVVLDQLEQAKGAGIHRRILCTPDVQLQEAAAASGVEVEYERPSQGRFHFGRRLLEVVRKRQLQSVLYLGGASAPLISADDFRMLLSLMQGPPDMVVANNVHSADIVGFHPASVLERITLPAIDNALPYVLRSEAGFRSVTVPRLLSLNFDLDTPGDLPILAVHPSVGRHTRAALNAIAMDVTRCQRVQAILFDPLQELVIFGRVGAPLFQFLDEQTRCRVRLYSEERSMKALGRDVRGEVCSLMGALVEQLGFEEYFRLLSRAAHGAVLDTRVLFAHWGWQLDQEDRFHSDWGRVDAIRHEGLRHFTEAAIHAPIPVLLGGHSLVAGGLWTLLDAGLRVRGFST